MARQYPRTNFAEAYRHFSRETQEQQTHAQKTDTDPFERIVAKKQASQSEGLSREELDERQRHELAMEREAGRIQWAAIFKNPQDSMLATLREELQEEQIRREVLEQNSLKIPKK